MTGVASGRHQAGEELLDIAHLINVDFVTLGTILVPSAVFRFVSPA